MVTESETGQRQKQHESRKGKLKAFEYRILRTLQREKSHESLCGRRILIACSGGMDSVALLHCFVRLAKRLQFEVVAAHVHHGYSAKPEVVHFRNEAHEFVRNLVANYSDQEPGYPVVKFASVNRSHDRSELRSEQELRQYRLQELRRLAIEHDCAVIAFAHHADDLFETRLIRLIRGTGPQGLRAMRYSANEAQKIHLRPFLFESRKSIAEYMQSLQKNISVEGPHKCSQWLEDPSNKNLEPLRNWLRHEWITMLERKRPGASEAFARSLDLFASAFGQCALTPTLSFSNPVLISRQKFNNSVESERHALILQTLRHLSIQSYGDSHIKEIAKRLKSPRKRFEFQVIGVQWSVDAEQICAKSDSSTTDDSIVTEA